MAARMLSNAAQLIASPRRATRHPTTRPDSPKALRRGPPGDGDDRPGAAATAAGGDRPSPDLGCLAQRADVGCAPLGAEVPRPKDRAALNKCT
jgi:hypothetical protein